MKQLTAIVTLVASLAITPCAFSKAILWVSDNGVQVSGQGVVYPADAANHIPLLPPFADQGFVDLLISSGYTVDRYRPDSGGLITTAATVVNRYDLVIVGAATNSGPFALQSRGRPGWNTEVRAPMIVTKSTLIRRDRMGWLLDNKEFDCGANSSTTSSPTLGNPGKQTFYVPSQPVFKGIGRTG